MSNEIIPLYPHFRAHKNQTVAQRLQAANEIWQDLMTMQCERRNGESDLANRNMLFLLFSRFIHELVTDTTLRGPILNNFDQQLFNDAMKAQEVCHE